MNMCKHVVAEVRSAASTYIPELNREVESDVCARVLYDYRQTIDKLLLDEFTIP